MCSQDAYGSAEHLSGKSPGVSSLLPGDLFDVELSKQDSGLGISVTVLFGKVFHPLRFFLPPLPFLSHCFFITSLRVYYSFSSTATSQNNASSRDLLPQPATALCVLYRPQLDLFSSLLHLTFPSALTILSKNSQKGHKI